MIMAAWHDAGCRGVASSYDEVERDGPHSVREANSVAA